MSLFLHRAVLVLMYVIAVMLIEHLIWNVVKTKRIAAWFELVGVLLIALSIVLTSVRPTYKVQSRNPRNNTELLAPDEPYSTIVQSCQVIGALLVIGGLGTEIGYRMGGGLRSRGAKRTPQPVR
jgi:hypothetical protein